MILTCLGSPEGSPSHWGHSILPRHFSHLKKWISHLKISYVKTLHSVKINKTSRILGRNPDVHISSKSRNLLRISTVPLLYNVKEEGGKPDRKPYDPPPPFPMVSEIHTETSSLRTLKIMPGNLNEFVRS
jgi:hypothetical protein